jgi:hypothetical protein
MHGLLTKTLRLLNYRLLCSSHRNADYYRTCLLLSATVEENIQIFSLITSFTYRLQGCYI